MKKITEEEGDKEAEEEEIEIGESTERPSRNERDLVEMDDLLFGSEEEDRRRKEEEEEEEEEKRERGEEKRGGTSPAPTGCPALIPPYPSPCADGRGLAV